MKIYVYKTTRFGRVDYKPACTISSLVCEWRDSASLTPKDLQFLKILGYEAVEKAVAKKDWRGYFVLKVFKKRQKKMSGLVLKNKPLIQTKDPERANN